MHEARSGTDLVEAPHDSTNPGAVASQRSRRSEAFVPTARCPQPSPRLARPVRQRPDGQFQSDRLVGPATTAGYRHAARRPRATVTRPGHPVRRRRGRASASIPRRRRRRSPPEPGPASARPALESRASCRKGSGTALKKRRPSPMRPQTTDRPQSCCYRGAPTTGRPSAAIWSTSRSRRGRTTPGGTTAVAAATNPGHARGHEATAARDVFGSSPVISSASTSCQAQPAGGSAEAASNSTISVTSPSSPSTASPVEVMMSLSVAVAAGSTTSTEARISGRLGSALLIRSVGSRGCACRREVSVRRRRRRQGQQCAPDEGPAGSPDSSQPRWAQWPRKASSSHHDPRSRVTLASISMGALRGPASQVATADNRYLLG